MRSDRPALAAIVAAAVCAGAASARAELADVFRTELAGLELEPVGRIAKTGTPKHVGGQVGSVLADSAPAQSRSRRLARSPGQPPLM